MDGNDIIERFVVVFDFDKTLTDRDTILGFYRQAESQAWVFRRKRLALLWISLAAKLGILDNDSIKNAGVKLFLYGRSRQEVDGHASRYATKVRLNDIYYQQFLEYPRENRVIVSASFEEYLTKILPEEMILGSRLSYQEGRVCGLARNLYGSKKATALRELGFQRVNVLYTDSLSDRPLMEMSKKVHLVRNGHSKIIKDQTYD